MSMLGERNKEMGWCSWKTFSWCRIGPKVSWDLRKRRPAPGSQSAVHWELGDRGMAVHRRETSEGQQLGSDGRSLNDGLDKSDFIQARMLLAYLKLMALGARVWLWGSTCPSSGLVSFQFSGKPHRGNRSGLLKDNQGRCDWRWLRSGQVESLWLGLRERRRKQHRMGNATKNLGAEQGKALMRQDPSDVEPSLKRLKDVSWPRNFATSHMRTERKNEMDTYDR